ncbi:MAG: S8 family serine peptidase [Hyphomonadaceae bacterium]|nr:S8 family serine peptidase [Hyphomonadaceae bacterium]MBC6413190.1 S8 family serine peptidase [Hyphomonadaceae bacterium]
MVTIPVLILTEAEDRLISSAVASAKAVAADQIAAMGVDPSVGDMLPDGIRLDDTFAAVPMGQGRSTPESLKMMATLDDEQFLVRGFIDSDQVGALAEHPGDGPRVFVDAQVGAMPICPGDPPLGNAADVRGLLNVGALSSRGLSGDGVAVAIVDTGINLRHLGRRGLSARLDPHIFWTPTPGVDPGGYPVGHGTMCAYCASITAPECTLLDFPVLNSTTQGGSRMDGFLSDAIKAYNVLLGMMRKPEAERPYHSLVVNNSWGMPHESFDFPPGHSGRYGDNPDHPFNQVVGSLAQAGADILFAAGNCGTDCPDRRCGGVTTNVINGANSHPDVLSIAGVDVTKVRVGYSSKGPGKPQLAEEKPDLAAYTHFNGSEAYGAGKPDSGTSAACPVAAGCIASVRTKFPPSAVSPPDMFDAARSTADGLGRVGWNDEVGYGIINPSSLADRVMAPSV